MAEAKKEKALLWRPYPLSARMATTGSGVQINGGALAAGASRPFPQEAFNFALMRPLWGIKFGFFVGRVAGGNMVDSDWDNVSILIKDTNTDQDLMKDDVPLSVLIDWQTKQYIFYPAKIPLQARGSGLVIKPTIAPGALGAPYNLTVSILGYTEERVTMGENFDPEQR